VTSFLRKIHEFRNKATELLKFEGFN